VFSLYLFVKKLCCVVVKVVYLEHTSPLVISMDLCMSHFVLDDEFPSNLGVIWHVVDT
jgi:hypothetical protein